MIHMVTKQLFNGKKEKTNTAGIRMYYYFFKLFFIKKKKHENP